MVFVAEVVSEPSRMALPAPGERRDFGAGGSVAVARNAAGRILFEWVMPRAGDGEPVRSPTHLAAAATRVRWRGA
jgi:hypothetical protein